MYTKADRDRIRWESMSILKEVKESTFTEIGVLAFVNKSRCLHGSSVVDTFLYSKRNYFRLGVRGSNLTSFKKGPSPPGQRLNGPGGQAWKGNSAERLMTTVVVRLKFPVSTWYCETGLVPVYRKCTGVRGFSTLTIWTPVLTVDALFVVLLLVGLVTSDRSP